MSDWWSGDTVVAAKGGDWWNSDPVATKPEPKTSQARALGEGLRSGASLGFGDEMAGASAAGIEGLDIPPEARISLIGRALSVPVGIARTLYEQWSAQNEKPATKAYETARDEVRSNQKEAQAHYPGTYLTGQIGGAAIIPVGAGAQVATLPVRMGRGALAGGAVGGLSGVGEGETPAERVTGGIVGTGAGAVLGAAAPVAIEGVVQGARAVGRPIANAIRGIRNPEEEAQRRVAMAIQRDLQADPNAATRLTPGEFAASAQNGGPATVMDLGGETTRGLARSAANTSPDGRQALNQTINDRFETQGGRVNDWLRRTFGNPNAANTQEAIERAGRGVNRGAYARAYNDGSSGIWSPELERLSGSPAVADAMKTAATTGKDRAIRDGFGAFNPPVAPTQDGRIVFNKAPNGTPTYPNLQFWDYTYRELRDAGRAATRAGREDQGALLTGLAQDLRSELDRAVPSFRQARQGAAAFFQAENALEAGQNYVTQNFATPEVRRSLARMTPQERDLFQQGFVSRFIENIDRVGDRRSVLNQIAASPAAREKLNIALGPQRAQELEAGLRVEGIMDLARGAVQGNSTTARQLAELGLAGGTYGIGTGGDVLNPNPTALMSAALVYGAARGKTRINENLSRHVAELLTSQDPAALVRGIHLVTRNQQLFHGLRRADIALARGAGPAPSPIPSSLVPAVAGDDQQGVPGRGN